MHHQVGWGAKASVRRVPMPTCRFRLCVQGARGSLCQFAGCCLHVGAPLQFRCRVLVGCRCQPGCCLHVSASSCVVRPGICDCLAVRLRRIGSPLAWLTVVAVSCQAGLVALWCQPVARMVVVVVVVVVVLVAAVACRLLLAHGCQPADRCL